MPLISFIITTFNASPFIERCLDSIISLKSSLPEIEIIVVDDASTDSTVEVIKRYARGNVKLICQPENHRIGAARNKALAISKGKYVAFVDSDDEAVSGIISSLKMAEERGLDMVAMCFARVSIDGGIKEDHLPFSSDEIFSGIDMQSRSPFYRASVWRYIFNKAFLDRVQYPFAEDVLYEDMDFLCAHLFSASRMAYCDECAYKFYDTPGSITHTISYKSLCDYALLGTRLMRLHEVFQNKTAVFANMVLEGGLFNVNESFLKLPKLRSCSEVCAFYDRLDTLYDRKVLYAYRKPGYRWNRWTHFCLSHRNLVVVMMSVIIPLYKIRSKLKGIKIHHRNRSAI